MKKVKIFLLIGCTLFGLFLFQVSLAWAVGLLVRPSELNFRSFPFFTNQKELTVINNTDVPAIYKIYPDSLKKNITVMPNEFQLNGNESKTVVVATKFLFPGKYYSTISAVARPMNAGQMAAASGVKISFKAVVVGTWIYWVALALFGICLGLIYRVKLSHVNQRKNS